MVAKACPTKLNSRRLFSEEFFSKPVFNSTTTHDETAYQKIASQPERLDLAGAGAFGRSVAAVLGQFLLEF